MDSLELQARLDYLMRLAVDYCKAYRQDEAELKARQALEEALKAELGRTR